MPIRWQNVLRDSLAIVVVSALVRWVGGSAEISAAAMGLLTRLVFIVGFCASGCLSPSGRFAHLGLVALATWLILAINGALTGAAEASGAYLEVLINTLIGMVLGGAASLAIVRPGAKASRPPA
jgi:hypothetical protein